MRLTIAILLVLGAVARAQVPFLGSCPQPPIQQYFDKERYLGTWFEYSNYFTFFQVGLRCVKAVYGDAGGNTISVLNDALRGSERSRIRGTARPVDKSGAARLRVEFPSTPNFGSGANYNVLYTDYDNVAIVWSCSDYKLVNAQILWILTRQRHPSPALIRSAEKRIRKYGLSVGKLSRTDQKKCPY